MTAHSRYFPCGYIHYHCGAVILDRASIARVEDERPRKVTIHLHQDGQDLPFYLRDPNAMSDFLAWYLTPPALAATTHLVTLSVAPAQIVCPLCQRGTSLLFAITAHTDPREVFFCGCETCLEAVRSSIAGSPHLPSDVAVFAHVPTDPSVKG